MSSKKIIWASAVLLVLTTVSVILRTTSTPSEDPSLINIEAPPVTENDWKLGNASATVTLIEYGDFQCPACAQYHPIVKRLVAEYGDRILFVFRNFPLTHIHDNAMIAAQAAEAAGLQGKYWAMHDLIFEKQIQWAILPFGVGTESFFTSLMSSAGGDTSLFKNDLNSEKVKTKVETDLNGGREARVEHTPTFFINLKRIKNPASYEEFAGKIDEALRAVQSN